MPKRIVYDDEDETGDEEEEIEEGEDEEFEEDIPKKKGRPKRFQKKPQPQKEPEPEPKEPPKRFIAFSTPQRIGIADAETNEVIAEGEFAVLQAMANMLERLERIENSLGSMMEG